jgi:hypothetical protein
MGKEYVEFRLFEKKAKTAVYEVVSKSTGEVLGTIMWYGPWRQYTFDPNDNTTWSSGCLKQVIAFLDKLMLERRKEAES